MGGPILLGRIRSSRGVEIIVLPSAPNELSRQPSVLQRITRDGRIALEAPSGGSAWSFRANGSDEAIRF
jgi:hypothetical protein